MNENDILSSSKNSGGILKNLLKFGIFCSLMNNARGDNYDKPYDWQVVDPSAVMQPSGIKNRFFFKIKNNNMGVFGEFIEDGKSSEAEKDYGIPIPMSYTEFYHESNNSKNVFVDIREVKHVFPLEIKELEFSVTLLHYHHHSHGFLVFDEDLKKSTYIKDVSNYYPCSWYMDDNDEKVFAYEFCKKNVYYSPGDIRKRLLHLKKLGYNSYGTTVRNITNTACEYETDSGHIYVNEDECNQGLKNIVGVGSETLVHYFKELKCVAVLTCYKSKHSGHEMIVGHSLQ